MSLNFTLTKIDDYLTVCWLPDPTDDEPDRKRINPVTEALVFLSDFVGLAAITEANAAEFYGRVSMWEKLHGAFLTQFENTVGRPRPITPADVVAHIGLTTNVITVKSSATWATRAMKGHREESDRDCRSAARQMTAYAAAVEPRYDTQEEAQEAAGDGDTVPAFVADPAGGGYWINESES